MQTYRQNAKELKQVLKKKCVKKGLKGLQLTKHLRNLKKQLRRSDNLLYYCYSIIANEYNYVYRVY